jgi:hypothetical protein
LLQRRIGFGQRRIPYEAITAIDPPAGGKARGAAVIVYGDAGPITYQQRITVEPNDFAGFMAELERHTPHASIHV